MDSTRRFATLVMGLGIVVLIGTILIGERIGDRSLGTPLDDTQNLVPVIAITPAPNASAKPYGPDWDSSYALSSAPDPGFPDPRVPPKPLPTPAPAATRAPAATHVGPTLNPNIPIWRQTPLPGTTPTPGAKAASPAAPAEPSAKPSTLPEPTVTPVPSENGAARPPVHPRAATPRLPS